MWTLPKACSFHIIRMSADVLTDPRNVGSFLASPEVFGFTLPWVTELPRFTVDCVSERFAFLPFHPAAFQLSQMPLFFCTARRGDQPHSSDLCSRYLGCLCHVSSYSYPLWTQELPNWLRPWGHPVLYLLMDASQTLILLQEAQAP